MAPMSSTNRLQTDRSGFPLPPGKTEVCVGNSSGSSLFSKRPPIQFHVWNQVWLHCTVLLMLPELISMNMTALCSPPPLSLSDKLYVNTGDFLWANNVAGQLFSSFTSPEANFGNNDKHKVQLESLRAVQKDQSSASHPFCTVAPHLTPHMKHISLQTGTPAGKMCICLLPSVLCPLHCSSSVLLLPCHPERFRCCRALQSRFCSARLPLRENYTEIKTSFPFFSYCSGPKRYDWTGEHWLYTHDGVTLHQLLSKEFSAIFNRNMDLDSLPCS